MPTHPRTCWEAPVSHTVLQQTTPSFSTTTICSTKLGNDGIAALTKFFVFEWSQELYYQLYHELPVDIYLAHIFKIWKSLVGSLANIRRGERWVCDHLFLFSVAVSGITSLVLKRCAHATESDHLDGLVLAYTVFASLSSEATLLDPTEWCSWITD